MDTRPDLAPYSMGTVYNGRGLCTPNFILHFNSAGARKRGTRLRERWGLTALREMARLRLRRLSAVGRPAGARPEERVADALLGGGVGSAADFNASGADGGGGSGPHGRDAGRISLPSDSYA